MDKTQTSSGATDTNELQSTRAGLGANEGEGGKTRGEKGAEDLKSEVGAKVKEYRDTAEKVWDDTKERVRTFKEDASEYVRENPTKTVLTALAIGFVLGLIAFRR